MNKLFIILITLSFVVYGQEGNSAEEKSKPNVLSIDEKINLLKQSNTKLESDLKTKKESVKSLTVDIENLLKDYKEISKVISLVGSRMVKIRSLLAILKDPSLDSLYKENLNEYYEKEEKNKKLSEKRVEIAKNLQMAKIDKKTAEKWVVFLNYTYYKNKGSIKFYINKQKQLDKILEESKLAENSELDGKISLMLSK